jgi:methylmalonyl-CoA mutase N-terminal domain/subunit
MLDRCCANERSRKFAYHCRTSGRSLSAQENRFNDLRTTLQASIATCGGPRGHPPRGMKRLAHSLG